MITGFEDQTEDLTKAELELVPIFVNGLNKKRSKANAITNAQIRKSLLTRDIRIADSRVRKIINHIRLRGLTDGVVIATGKGYYVTRDVLEISNYIDSLTERIEAIQAIRDNIQFYLMNLIEK